MNKDKFDSYTFSEGKTGIGQMVEFTCRSEDVGKVKEFLETIRTIDIPTTGRVNLAHGAYGRYTRFDIVQHKYAGGGNESGGGYIEVLEIKNPPDGRCGIVIYEYSSHGDSVFYEFSNLPDAALAFEKNWGGSGFSKCEGFLRQVVCNRFYTPWFYAVGSQLLLDDFVLPNIIDEDPILRYGRRFVVRDYDGLPTIKTCMGTRFIKHETDQYGGETESFRLTLWDDGTVWDEYRRSKCPRPLDEGELWIQDAMDKFRKLLTGKTSKFTIDFIDGSKFIGKLKPKDGKSHSAGGRYKARLTLKGGRILEGIFDFKPTPEIPTVEESIYSQAKKAKREIVSIDSMVKILKGEGEWAGVYPAPK